MRLSNVKKCYKLIKVGFFEIKYDSAPRGEKTTMIHLFAIKYADDLNSMDESLDDLLKQAGMPVSYVTELNKGRRLGKYVECK